MTATIPRCQLVDSNQYGFRPGKPYRLIGRSLGKQNRGLELDMRACHAKWLGTGTVSVFMDYIRHESFTLTLLSRCAFLIISESRI